jgi:serine/threonine protein phosphatase 1
MSRTLAIGDIHGGFKALQQVLERIDLQENDELIFLGDYVDGWSESAQVIEYLIQLGKSYKCVFIKGNHDAWCEKWLAGLKADPIWLMHGGQETVDSYAGFSEEQKRAHLTFFNSMPMYHLSEEQRLFVHAGFTSMHGVERESHETNFYKDRTLWEMALVADRSIETSSHYYPNRLKHYKEIYIGHTPTLRYNSFEPMQALNVFNVDTGAAFFGRLSAIDIHSKEVFQSDAVEQLYADEKGRNSQSYNAKKAAQPGEL